MNYLFVTVVRRIKLRVESSHLYPHQTQQEAISGIKFILSQTPKQLLFSDSMHVQGPLT